MKDILLKVLQEKFGFQDFRYGQREVIETLLEHKQVLCLQPTGHGKSLLYQLPSVLIDQMTLVISPLLALMRDQIQHLEQRFSIPAATINTDQTEEKNEKARQSALNGHIRLLFVAPEQLDNLKNCEFIRGLPIGFIAIDEAHCISTWGHDFRPSYRQIVNIVQIIKEKNPNLYVLGLTATADQRTEADIIKQLQDSSSRPIKVLRSSMDRPNISLSVIRVKGVVEKLEILKNLLSQLEGCGILYCATREQTELVASYLQEQEMNVASYHAGYDSDQKRLLQQAFIKGNYKAIASTNALGMGIDKQDVRFIIHVDIPGSITAYYQEVGRAGRDGKEARGILLFDPDDAKIQEHFIQSAQPTIDDFKNLLNCLEPDEEGLHPSLMGIRVRTGLHPTRVTVILAELIEQGLVQKKLVRDKQVYERTGKDIFPDITRYKTQEMVRKKELDGMLIYGYGEVECLMHSLRIALGDTISQPCGRCSLCQPNSYSPITITSRAKTEEWLVNRNVPIPATKQPNMSEGFAILNGDLRTSMFIQFMQSRGQAQVTSLSRELQAFLLKKLSLIKQQYKFSALVSLPSRTWGQREWTSIFLGKELGIPVYLDLLMWETVPEYRQGELLNNDQRKENVNTKMTLTSNMPQILKGAILVLDDYIGSGATIKESVRVLRKQGMVKREIVPLTLARIRWRLGAKGIIQ
jgi:ATP-dependent DNA helicase RecQ